MSCVFREPWHGGEVVFVAGAVAAGIDEEAGKACFMQRGCQGQHDFGVATPAVKYHDGRLGARTCSRHEPAEQGLAVFSGNPNGAERQPQIGWCAVFGNTLGRQAAMDGSSQ